MAHYQTATGVCAKMMSLLLFALGVAVGITLAEKSQRRPPPTPSELQDRLTVATNLNDSLRRDLDEAKEKIWKLKQLETK